MKIKIRLKRFYVTLLAMIMVISMVQGTALAAQKAPAPQITLKGYYQGSTPETVEVSCVSEGFSVYAFNVYNMNSGSKIEVDSKAPFTNEIIYGFELLLKLEAGYELDKSVINIDYMRINGNKFPSNNFFVSAEKIEGAGYDVRIFWYPPKLLEAEEENLTPISLAAAKLKTPIEPGVIYKKGISVDTTNPNYRVSLTRVIDKDTQTILYAGNKFIEGHTYTVWVKFTAMDWYRFTGNTEFYICGTKAEREDRDSIVASLVTYVSDKSKYEFCWIASSDKGESWFTISDWKQGNEWLDWTPASWGEYTIAGKIRVAGEDSTVIQASAEANYHPHIKGKCQMPYAGKGGGYLIGIETFDNPNQSYRYEMLILDCTLLAQGKDAWIYTTGKCGVPEGNALWTVWQPQYGYYWTLFRVFDANDNLIDQECYGFVNAY